MDIPELPVALKDAGVAFDRDLRRLGLRCDALTWAWDARKQTFFLFLVWAGFDRFGPVPIAEKIFAAYRGSALPEEIDPFIVNVVGVNGRLAKQVMSMDRGGGMVRLTPRGEGPHVFDLHITGSWIIHRERKPHSIIDVKKDWQRFQSRVDELAA
jgi:hypothetical protein